MQRVDRARADDTGAVFLKGRRDRVGLQLRLRDSEYFLFVVQREFAVGLPVGKVLIAEPFYGISPARFLPPGYLEPVRK